VLCQVELLPFDKFVTKSPIDAFCEWAYKLAESYLANAHFRGVKRSSGRILISYRPRSRFSGLNAKDN
jgi:hypothetical protein